MFVLGIISVVGLTALLYVVYKLGIEVGKTQNKENKQ